MPSGSRLIFVRIRSGWAIASSRGRKRMLISRASATSAFASSSTRSAKSALMLSNSKSIRAASGVMLPPVTWAPKSRQMTPQRTWSAVCVRINWCRCCQFSVPITASPTAGAEPSSSCQISPSRRRTPTTRRSMPLSHAIVPTSHG